LRPPPPHSPLLPYTTLFRSRAINPVDQHLGVTDNRVERRAQLMRHIRQKLGFKAVNLPKLLSDGDLLLIAAGILDSDGDLFSQRDRKSTRLSSSHVAISYAV